MFALKDDQQFAPLCFFFALGALLKACRRRWWPLLDAGRFEQIVRQALQHLPVDPDLKKTEGGEIQQSGMERTLWSTNAIIALRCMMKSNRLEDYWESRVV